MYLYRNSILNIRLMFFFTDPSSCITGFRSITILASPLRYTILYHSLVDIVLEELRCAMVDNLSSHQLWQFNYRE